MKIITLTTLIAILSLGCSSQFSPIKISASQSASSTTSPTPMPTPTPNQTQTPPQPPASVPTSPSALWPNEPPGFVAVNDWGFDTLNGGGWHAEPGDSGIAIDSTAPVSAGTVYEQRYSKGFVGGSSPSNLWTTFSPTPELYLGFYWKASSDWEGHPTGVNKIIFVSTDHSNPIIITMCGQTQFTACLGYQNVGIDNGELAGFPGVTGTIQLYSGVKLVPGNWYRLELHVKRSRTTTSKDGVFQLWVNGQSAIDVRTMNFEEDNFSSIPIVPVWGGVGGVKSRPGYFRYDHIRISVPK